MDLVLATSLIGAWLAAQSVSDGGIPYFNEGVVGLTVAAILTLFWKIQRSYINPLANRVQDQDKELKQGRRQLAIVSWRNGELIRFLRENGLAVPDNIAYGRPQWLDDEDDS